MAIVPCFSTFTSEDIHLLRYPNISSILISLPGDITVIKQYKVDDKN